MDCYQSEPDFFQTVTALIAMSVKNPYQMDRIIQDLCELCKRERVDEETTLSNCYSILEHIWYLAHIRATACTMIEAFFDSPRELASAFLTLPRFRDLWYDKENADRLYRELRSKQEAVLDGEMSYWIEEQFLNAVKKELVLLVEAGAAEKRRRFQVWHEELIANVMAPARLERLAAAAGMECVDYMEKQWF